jgi:hypothetical protein
MSKRISEPERIVGYFHAHKGEAEADTVFNIVRGMYRVSATAKRAPSKPRTRRAVFVQAADPQEVE